MASAQQKYLRAALRRSIREEEQTVKVYTSRALNAQRAGDRESAKLWEHILAEEQQHQREFMERLAALSQEGV